MPSNSMRTKCVMELNREDPPIQAPVVALASGSVYDI